MIDVAVGNGLRFDVVSKPSPFEVKFILTQEDLQEMEKVSADKMIRKRILDSRTLIEKLLTAILDMATLL